MMMERHQVLELMLELKLTGMRNAYDEVIADALRRQHSAQHVIGDLLKAEVADKQARSIKYHMTASRLPLAQEIDGFEFAGTPINEGLVCDLATGSFLATQRNVVLIGGTGSGKTHLRSPLPAIASAAGRGFASTTPPTSSTYWNWKPIRDGPENLPSTSLASTFWFSTSSAICPLRGPVASCCSTSSAGSMSAPPWSSRPTWPSGNGPACSAMPR